MTGDSQTLSARRELVNDNVNHFGLPGTRHVLLLLRIVVYSTFIHKSLHSRMLFKCYPDGSRLSVVPTSGFLRSPGMAGAGPRGLAANDGAWLELQPLTDAPTALLRVARSGRGHTADRPCGHGAPPASLRKYLNHTGDHGKRIGQQFGGGGRRGGDGGASTATTSARRRGERRRDAAVERAAAGCVKLGVRWPDQLQRWRVHARRPRRCSALVCA